MARWTFILDTSRHWFLVVELTGRDIECLVGLAALCGAFGRPSRFPPVSCMHPPKHVLGTQGGGLSGTDTSFDLTYSVSSHTLCMVILKIAER